MNPDDQILAFTWHGTEVINSYVRVRRVLQRELDREPSDVELARALGVTPGEIQEIRTVAEARVGESVNRLEHIHLRLDT